MATPLPPFEGLTEEELEYLLGLRGYATPCSGNLLATGDEIPWWVFAAAGAGLAALVAFVALNRKRGYMV